MGLMQLLNDIIFIVTNEPAPGILVVRMSSLGDIILTAPVLRNLRRRWPDARITMLVKPHFAAAAARSPFVSDILAFDGLAAALKAIKNGRYDILLDLHDTLRSRLLSALSGVKLKARYRKDSLARRLFVNFRVPSPALEKHTLEKVRGAPASSSQSPITGSR